MYHSENIYGDKHKKQSDARKQLEFPILLVVAAKCFLCLSPYCGLSAACCTNKRYDVWVSRACSRKTIRHTFYCNPKGFAHNRVFYRFLSKPCHILTESLSPTNCNLVAGLLGDAFLHQLALTANVQSL